MKVQQRLGILVAIVVFALQGVFGFCNKQLKYCFTISPTVSPLNDGKDYVEFRLEAPANVGWAGIGVGKYMTTSYLIVAWPNSSGNVTVSQRKANGYYEPDPTPNQSDLILDAEASGIQNGKFVAVIRRAVTVEDSTIQTGGKQWFVYAIGPSRPSDEYNATLEQHQADHMGVTELDVGQGGQGITDKYLTIHAIFMLLAWAVATPLAIFIARFGKKALPNSWFRLHWGIQAFVTTICVILGFTFAVLAMGGLQHEHAHHKLGYVIIIGFIAQLGLGVFHHVMFDKRREYVPIWTKVHWWVGRLLFILVLIQIELGLRLFAEVTMGWYVAYYVYISTIFAIFFSFSFRQWLYWRRKSKASGYEFDDNRNFVKMDETGSMHD
ncbi:9370_t:CDS:2 [Paraglomus occultum]|uniref:9370_t:CDS:1 n=1 Tax=Paraglomus occultum TaxID=144539 RepID=A0A9N9BFJ7_9GLOM|nr:9370_t:CDS:2 [Paraglomus occultum]